MAIPRHSGWPGHGCAAPIGFIWPKKLKPAAATGAAAGWVHLKRRF
ncbi:hypothetical protein Z950_2653 [Sulfitobacter mediterraneus KCTC 32188]|nr:hypothetical protein Z950_2653 [Sulfitobacter mediterraneus KCTC 32188]